MQPARVNGDAVTVARRIVSSRVLRVGFVPADARTRVPPAIRQIAVALAEIGESGVATVGAPESVASAGAAGSARGMWTFSKAGPVSVFVPSEKPEPGRWLAELDRFLADSVASRELVLIDFTGLDAVGELGGAAALVDACCVVAEARATKERDMEEACARLPLDRFLGILLV